MGEQTAPKIQVDTKPDYDGREPLPVSIYGGALQYNCTGSLTNFCSKCLMDAATLVDVK